MIKRFLILFIVCFSIQLQAADFAPSFETQDIDGSSSHYNGTVGTSAVSIPSSADKVISEFILKCPIQTPLTKECLVSLDGGTNFFSLRVGEHLGWSPKGSMKQIQVKGSTSGVEYEILMNFESF